MLDIQRLGNVELLTGLHACAMALSPNGKFLVVANAGSDTVSVIDTRTDKIVETICARQNPGDPSARSPMRWLSTDRAKNFLSATARKMPSPFSSSSQARQKCSA